MNLNREGQGEDERYRKAVIEIGDHISSSLALWPLSEERTQWRR